MIGCVEETPILIEGGRHKYYKLIANQHDAIFEAIKDKKQGASQSAKVAVVQVRKTRLYASNPLRFDLHGIREH